MSVKFQRPETIICELEVRSSASVLIDPSSTPKLTVCSPVGVAVVSDATMTRTGVGKFSHDYTPAADADLGWYGAKFTVTDGGRVTIRNDGFSLESS